MGCQDYYKKALQYFAFRLEENDELADKLFEEKSIAKLENYILKKKKTLSTKNFFFSAGYISSYLLQETYREDGSDEYTICLEALYRFDKLIGLN